MRSQAEPCAPNRNQHITTVRPCSSQVRSTDGLWLQPRVCCRVRQPGATRCYGLDVKTISQRELRNDNAAIMAGVEGGETYVVTRRGVPVAALGPVEAASDLRCAKPAGVRPDFSRLPRVSSSAATAEILADLRGDR